MMRKGGGDKARGPGQPLAPSPEITYQPFQLVGFEPTGGPEVGPLESVHHAGDARNRAPC